MEIRCKKASWVCSGKHRSWPILRFMAYTSNIYLYLCFTPVNQKIKYSVSSENLLVKPKLSMGVSTNSPAPCTSHVFYWSHQLVIMWVSVSFVSPPCTKEFKLCAAARGEQVAVPAIRCQQACPYQRRLYSCAALVPHGSASCGPTTAQTNSLSHLLTERHQHRRTISYSQRDIEQTGDLWPLSGHRLMLHRIRGLWYEVEQAGRENGKCVCALF